jgi:hypothetical protein
MKAAPKQRPSRANLASSTERISSRRRQVQALHARGLPIAQIATRLSVSEPTVKRDFKALGIKGALGAPGMPKARKCAREGCDVVFTPPRWLIARGGGKFHSRACANAAMTIYSPAEPRACKRCGTIFTPPRNQASGDRGHYCTRDCANKHHAVHPEPEPRPCAQCGNEFTPTAGNVAKSWGRYCSRACVDEAKRIHPVADERTCARPGCGRVFTPPGWLAAKGYGRYCGSVCWGKDRWQEGTVSRALVAELPGQARQRWLGRWEGRRSGKLGGRPKTQLTDEQVTEARRLAGQGWGRRPIATRLGVSERAVRNVLST